MKRVILLVGVVAAMLATAAFANTPPKKKAKKPPSPNLALLLHPKKLHGRAPELFRARFTTTKGVFTVTVHRAWAPHGADRFYNLVRAGFYDGQRFFRVIPGSFVQWGINSTPRIARVWTHATILDDPVEHSNTVSTMAFAATSARNSRTTQVFVNLGDNSALDAAGFAPFGAVTKGLAVLRKLYRGYGEQPSARQAEMTLGGDAFFRATFPKLDGIRSTRILG